MIELLTQIFVNEIECFLEKATPEDKKAIRRNVKLIRKESAISKEGAAELAEEVYNTFWEKYGN